MHYRCTIISKMRQASEVKPWKLKFLIFSNSIQRYKRSAIKWTSCKRSIIERRLLCLCGN